MCSPNPTAQLTVQFFPLHEPPPHPIPLSLGGGEGARRAGEGLVHGPNACEKRMKAAHDPAPSSRPSPPVGEKVPDSSAVALAKAEGRLRGSWFQCVRKSERRLPLNCAGRSATPGRRFRGHPCPQNTW